MNKLPQGKGYYIWGPPGNPITAATLAKEAGISHVLIKICDGINRYPFPSIYPVDPTPALVQAFQAHGIDVWGWGYVYGNNPAGEATRAVNRAIELGVSGFVVNAEHEYKQHSDRHNRARAYMAGLRAGLGADFPIGLSSYRYPSYHPQLPWLEFLSKCDFNSPQVYWIWATNAGYQLRRSVQEFSQMAIKRPIVPTGSAFAEHGWAAKPAEVTEFLTVAQELGLQGANFWEWSHTRSRLPALWDLIADYPWTQSEPEPEPGGDEEVKTKFVTLIANQNVRAGPGTTHKITGQLVKGQVLYPVRELAVVSPIEVWARFDQGWIAVVHGGTRYLRTA